MKNTDVPIWLKYSLTLEGASNYFRIGEKKLRRMVEENPETDWINMNGNRIQIKGKPFGKSFDTWNVI